MYQIRLPELANKMQFYLHIFNAIKYEFQISYKYLSALRMFQIFPKYCMRYIYALNDLSCIQDSYLTGLSVILLLIHFLILSLFQFTFYMVPHIFKNYTSDHTTPSLTTLFLLLIFQAKENH
jgi:hypothetical protein